jgi:hypothetical protein
LKLPEAAALLMPIQYIASWPLELKYLSTLPCAAASMYCTSEPPRALQASEAAVKLAGAWAQL